MTSEPDGIEAPFNFKQVQKQEEEALGKSDAGRAALCISGGGIRCATFALGALQALADLDILQNFDYLSTVSGGGYIGSWLTAWKKREEGLKNVIPKLKSSASFSARGDPDPVQHLREYNNYLSPKLGFFSSDTWTLVTMVARNMLLNWLVFIPLLMFALMLPRIVLSLARLAEAHKLWYENTWYGPTLDRFFAYQFAQQNVVVLLLAIIGALLFALGVLNVLRYLPSVGNKDHTQGDFLVWCVGPIFLAAVTLLIIDAWFRSGEKTHRSTVSFLEFFLWIGGSAVLSWLALLVSHADIRRKWKLNLVVTSALLLTVLSFAGVARLLISEYFRNLTWAVYVTTALPMLLVSYALVMTVFVGLISSVLEDEDLEWLARGGAWRLLTALAWAAICALTLLAPKLLFYLHLKVPIWADSAVAVAAGVCGVLAALAGFSSKTRAQRDGSPTAKTLDPSQTGQVDSKRGVLLDAAGKLAAPVFIVVFLTSLAVFTNWILWKCKLVQADWKQHYDFLEKTRPETAVIFALALLALSRLLAKFININRFSLNGMYRSRLIRAYPGASNKGYKTNPFTGFADNDNLWMKDLKCIAPDPCVKPFHVVNMALNLVSGERLAWQQRKTESFTVSPLHCGYGESSYRPTAGYGGKGGISLGTAVSISGAAASSNMGYHSSPAMTFIMTLFSARLGAWLGNPNKGKWRHEGPQSLLQSIVREAFGLSTDSSPYVYLSDGGHFENLAMYEMLRRRCRYMVVLDGGADPNYSYQELANALRKIRIDQKTLIQFESPFLLPAREPEVRCAVATIQYPDGSTGQLVYVKPVVLGSEPPDVTAYKAANADFPHQNTANQRFDESQTESYRMLGLCSIKDIFKPWDRSAGFQGVVDAARVYLRPRAANRSLATYAARNANFDPVVRSRLKPLSSRRPRPGYPATARPLDI